MGPMGYRFTGAGTRVVVRDPTLAARAVHGPLRLGLVVLRQRQARQRRTGGEGLQVGDDVGGAGEPPLAVLGQHAPQGDGEPLGDVGPALPDRRYRRLDMGPSTSGPHAKLATELAY